MVNIHVDIALRETLFREVDIYKTNGRGGRKDTKIGVGRKRKMGRGLEMKDKYRDCEK